MKTQPRRTSPPAPQSSRFSVITLLDWAMEGIILLILTGTPWLFGGIQPYHVHLACAGIGLVLVLWALKQLLNWQLTLHFCWVSLVLVLFFLVSCLYLIPLPRSTLQLLSPETVKLYQALLPASQEVPVESVLDEQPVFPPGTTLSVYPGATQQYILLFLAAIALFLVVRHGLATPERLKRLAWVMVINGSILSIFALIQKVRAPVYTIYGIVVPGDPFGPFINRNHFCSYVNMAVCLGLGLFFSVMQRSGGMYQETTSGQKVPVRYSLSMWSEILQHPQAVWLLIPVAVCMTAVMASLSRGGILAFVVGLLVALVAWKRKGGSQNIWIILAIPLVALGLLLWYGAAPTLQRLEEDTLAQEGRFTIWKACLEATRRFPLFGTGFGTFATIEPLYRPQGADQNIVHEHAHSEYMEALVEGGVIRLLLTVSLLWLVLRQGWLALQSRRRSSGQAMILGAWAACITLAVQSIGEFGIHVPAITALLIVTAGYLVALGGTRRDEEEDTSLIRWHYFGIGPILALSFALTVGFILFAGTWMNWQFEAHRLDGLFLRQKAKDDPAELNKAVQRLDQAILLQPGFARARMERYEIEEQRLLAVLAKERAVFNRCLCLQQLARIHTGLARLQNDPFYTLAEDVIQPFLGQALFSKQHAARQAESWKSQQQHLRMARNLSPLAWRPHLEIAQHVLPLKTELAPTDRALYWKSSDPLTSYLNRMKLLQPFRSETWFLCGQQEWLNGMRESAVATWRRSLELSDEFLQPIMTEAAFSFLQPEMKFTTQELLDKLIPSHIPRLHVKAAWTLFPGQDKTQERKPFMERAIQLLEKKTDLSLPENQYDYGLAMWGIDKKEQAYQHLQVAVLAQPDKTMWRLDLGRLCFELEKYADAREHLQLVLRRYPQNAEALLLLEKLDQLQRPAK